MADLTQNPPKPAPPRKKVPKPPVLGVVDVVGAGDTYLVADFLPPELEDGVFEKLQAEVNWQSMYHRGACVLQCFFMCCWLIHESRRRCTATCSCRGRGSGGREVCPHSPGRPLNWRRSLRVTCFQLPNIPPPGRPLAGPRAILRDSGNDPRPCRKGGLMCLAVSGVHR